MSKNFRQQPLVAVKGEGMYIWDRAGKRYLDFIGGIAVNGLGHSHPRLVEAGSRQLAQLWHVSNLYFSEPRSLLAVALSALCGGSYIPHVARRIQTHIQMLVQGLYKLGVRRVEQAT